MISYMSKIPIEYTGYESYHMILIGTFDTRQHTVTRIILPLGFHRLYYIYSYDIIIFISLSRKI